jgi:hypothetical protein
VVEQHQRWVPQAARLAFAAFREDRKSAWVKAQGNSMRPLIAPGARLLVDFGAAPARVGEIILFQQGDRVVAHRLVAWPSGGPPIAKGDFEPYCDGPVAFDTILGVVRALDADGAREATSAACGGWSAQAIAGASWWGSRAAALARRMSTVLPDPLRRVALGAIPPLARVAALALFAPIIWAAHKYTTVNAHGEERR